MRHHGVLGAAVVLFVGSGAAHALDLSGTWRFQFPSTSLGEIVHVTQSGSAVSFTLGGLPFSGTVSTGGAFATYTVTAGMPVVARIDGRIMPSENLLDGRAVSFVPPNPPSAGGVFATRCTCDDGNVVDGDGCDAKCRVEPCWTCTGDPSVCTPASDGSACEDGNACTSGETCTAGACGGGTPISPCIDTTGRWNRHREIPDEALTVDFATDFEQRGTDLIAGSYVGTIDTATGAFDLRAANPNLFCQSFDPLLGSVAPSGTTYSATGNTAEPDVSIPDECNQFSLTETGTRCGTGTLELTETCDDGNLTDGDGCSAGCTIEPCWACTGAPSTCLPAPRAPCRASTRPDRSFVRIKNVPNDADDRIDWAWKKGAGTTHAELGDPVAGADYTLCAFDESSVVPVLSFSATVQGDGACDGSPCWRTSGDTGFVYKNRSATPSGVVTLKLTAGTDGKAKALLKGKGVHLSDRPHGLPALPLTMPLRVQLVGDGGLCLETRHDASGVVKNDAARGVFKARGTP